MASNDGTRLTGFHNPFTEPCCRQSWLVSASRQIAKLGNRGASRRNGTVAETLLHSRAPPYDHSAFVRLLDKMASD
jgi:hypothetical protein